MILIDTSVWIDFLAGRQTPQVAAILSILKEEETVSYIGPILQELLQGCANEADAAAIEQHFEPFIELHPDRSSYRLAAKIFRDCRAHGFTIRSSIDCLIAACALEHDCTILHRDRDFSFIGKVCDLDILEP